VGSVAAPLVLWRSAADELAHAMRRHGVDPDAVTDVRTAWIAFREFAQVKFSGLDPTPESDADGLIVQWGRYSWNRNKLSLSFTRQLAVIGDTEPDEPDWQPAYWQVELVLLFEDAPELQALDSGTTSDTGFSFEPPGSGREAVLNEIGENEQIKATLTAVPVASSIHFGRTD
jgi:hypothetical protein